MKFRFGAVSLVLIFNIICFLLLCLFPHVDRKMLLVSMGLCCGAILITYIAIYAFDLGDPYPFLVVAMITPLAARKP